MRQVIEVLERRILYLTKRIEKNWTGKSYDLRERSALRLAARVIQHHEEAHIDCEKTWEVEE